jgi:acetylornithine deacetylase/succinyl-diaminopimelate desuccinylase-like protein
MDHPTRLVATLAQDLVRIDSRSSVSNLKIAERLERELTGFEVERMPYSDDNGFEKVALVATRGRGGMAFSGHMDTVPDTGWLTDPWSGRIEDDVLYGLGATDMKGPVAALVVAAQSLPGRIPIALLLTTDEETTKQGARVILGSGLAQHYAPSSILIAEPTNLAPVRGHRAHIEFTAVATGTQAHSSTGRGRNANWDLVPFLATLRTIHDRLRTEPGLQDSAYEPPYSDFNLVIDNHGTAVNVTVARATVKVKFRYSAGIDPAPIVAAVREAAASARLKLTEQREGSPPELPADHRLIRTAAELTGNAVRTAPYGTDASILQELAPCLIMGPGDIAVAHTPHEAIKVTALAEAVPVFQRMAELMARG